VHYVKNFISPSSKTPIYRLALLSEPTTGAICHKGGPETEFTTTGIWFILGIKHPVSSRAL